MNTYVSGGDTDERPSDGAEERAKAETAAAYASDLLNQLLALVEQERYKEAAELLGDWQPLGLDATYWLRYHFVKGAVSLNLAEMTTAYDELNRALQIANQLADRAYIGYVSYRLGVYHYRSSQFAIAEGYFVESWKVIKERAIRNNIKLSMYVNLSLGNTVMRRGNYRGAISHYRDALRDLEYLHSSKWLGSIYWGIGLCQMYIGMKVAAKVNMARGLRIQQDVAVNSFLAEMTGMYGMVLVVNGQFDAAERELRHAIYLSQQVNSKSAYLIACANMAELNLHRGTLDPALEWAERTVGEARMMQVSALNMAQTLHTLGNIHAARHEFVAAKKAFAEAEPLMRESKDEDKLGQLLKDYGKVLAQCGEYASAMPKLEQAVYKNAPRMKLYTLT